MIRFGAGNGHLIPQYHTIHSRGDFTDGRSVNTDAGAYRHEGAERAASLQHHLAHVVDELAASQPYLRQPGDGGHTRVQLTA